MRTVFAAITDPDGTPREGLPVYFHAPAGHPPVVAGTDASGVFRLTTGERWARVSGAPNVALTGWQKIALVT